jgi:signal transduction histidine kinase
MATSNVVPAIADRPAMRGQPRLAVVAAVALAGLVTTLCSFGLALASAGASGVQVFLLEWISVPYIVAGLIAWWRRPDSRLGVLMVAGGFATGLSALGLAHLSVTHTVGIVFDVLPVVLFLHVFLAFPDGRLRSSFERALVIAGYAAAVGLQLVKMSFNGVGDGNLLAITTRTAVAHRVEQVQLLTISALCLVGIGVLLARRRQAGRPFRRPLALLIDSFSIGLLMIAVLFVLGATGGPAFQTIQRATLIVIGISPIVFLIALLDARLARSAVADLFVELRADPSPTGLQEALARALRDPTLTLAYWLPEFDTWAGLDGQRVALPEAGDRQTATFIDRDGTYVAALLHDPALDDEPELLAAVGAAAGIALENGRLQAEQKAHLEELKGSRARVIAASQKERQRLERNLHDGAQQRLVALSLELSLLEKKLVDDPETAARLDQARREVAVSLDELRAVSRGLHPAVLSGHGLEVALQSIAAHSPTPVQLTVRLDGRLPEEIEVAAFYVVSESLANVGKHAQATSVRIDVEQTDRVVVVEVVDDGVGGADTEHGSGLRGLADRVEAHGGRLRIWSPAGGGTRLRAEMPCA